MVATSGSSMQLNKWNSCSSFLKKEVGVSVTGVMRRDREELSPLWTREPTWVKGQSRVTAVMLMMCLHGFTLLLKDTMTLLSNTSSHLLKCRQVSTFKGIVHPKNYNSVIINSFSSQGFFICHMINYTGYNQKWNVGSKVKCKLSQNLKESFFLLLSTQIKKYYGSQRLH